MHDADALTAAPTAPDPGTGRPAIELSIEFSHGPSQPYLLRTYDIAGTRRTKLAYSQTYAERDQAWAAAEALRLGRVRYGTLLANDGRYVWQAIAEGGEVVATSLTGFASLGRARAQLEQVRANAARAVVADHTLRGDAIADHARRGDPEADRSLSA